MITEVSAKEFLAFIGQDSKDDETISYISLCQRAMDIEHNSKYIRIRISETNVRHILRRYDPDIDFKEIKISKKVLNNVSSDIYLSGKISELLNKFSPKQIKK